MGRVLTVLAIVVVVLGAATARVIYSGEAELRASTEALDAGDAREAIVRARRAARWYAPGAPHVAVAYTRLVALAEASEANRRDDLALLAWRAVRVAAIETNWLVASHPLELERANQAIARIVAKQPQVAEPDARIQQEELQKLRRHEPPRTFWVVLLVGGFASLAAGLALWARQVAGAGGRLSWRDARLGAVLTLVGAVTWLLAVWRS